MIANNMIVENKNSNKVYDVYDITYNKSGYPQFLIYKDGEWVRLSAKYFKPYKKSLSSFDRLMFETF